MASGLCYKHKLHGHISIDCHFCVINIPNVRSHGEMSVITDILPWGYKIELIFSNINCGHIFTAKIWAWKITDILPWSRTNVRECVYTTDHRSAEQRKSYVAGKLHKIPKKSKDRENAKFAFIQIRRKCSLFLKIVLTNEQNFIQTDDKQIKQSSRTWFKTTLKQQNDKNDWLNINYVHL